MTLYYGIDLHINDSAVAVLDHTKEGFVQSRFRLKKINAEFKL